MPTSEERREVATRLRAIKFEDPTDMDIEKELNAFYNALECDVGQKRWTIDPYQFLADLIEPEPMCVANITFTQEQQEELFQRVMEELRVHGCPNCGAEVV